MEIDLSSRVAVVTGAGGDAQGEGVGQAIALTLAQAGAKIAIFDVNAEAAATTKRLINEQGGIAEIFVTDVSCSETIENTVQSCVDLLGAPDILVNNVGIGSMGGAVSLPEADWDKVMNINLKSMFLMSKFCIPHMKATGASIVNVSSIAAYGYTGIPLLAYSVSKAGVHQLTREIALEMAPQGLRVNTVVVGMLDTPMMRRNIAAVRGEDAVEEIINMRNAQVPVGWQGNAQDIAYAALFLASDMARFITGTELVVDGGSTAKCN